MDSLFPTTTFEEWRQAFILACQKLGVKAIPAHWNLVECWRTGDKPERLAEDAKFWVGI